MLIVTQYAGVLKNDPIRMLLNYEICQRLKKGIKHTSNFPQNNLSLTQDLQGIHPN